MQIPVTYERMEEEVLNTDDERTSKALRVAAMQSSGICEQDNGGSLDPYELLLRTKAEFENYRRRVEAERGSAYGGGVEALAREIFPVRRNLELALQAARQSDDCDDAVVQGVALTLKSLDDALARYDIKRIEALGSSFDPKLHDAVSAHPSAEHPENSVIHELEPGYVKGEKTLLPSRVVVSTTPAEEKEEG